MHFSMDPATVIVVFISILSIYAFARYQRSGSVVDEQNADRLLTQAHQARERGETANQELLLKQALQLYDSGVATDFTKRSSCLVHLASCVSKQGRFEEARKYMDKLLSYWRSILSKGDAQSLADIDYFVATADFGGFTYEVSEFFAEVIERKKRVFGSVHDEVANSMVLRSQLLTKLGEKEQAAQLEQLANEIRAQLKAS